MQMTIIILSIDHCALFVKFTIHIYTHIVCTRGVCICLILRVCSFLFLSCLSKIRFHKVLAHFYIIETFLSCFPVLYFRPNDVQISSKYNCKKKVYSMYNKYNIIQDTYMNECKCSTLFLLAFMVE